MLEDDIFETPSSPNLLLENAQQLPTHYTDSTNLSLNEGRNEHIYENLKSLEPRLNAQNGHEDESVILIEDNCSNSNVVEVLSHPVDLRTTTSTSAIGQRLSLNESSGQRNESVESTFHTESQAKENANENERNPNISPTGVGSFSISSFSANHNDNEVEANKLTTTTKAGKRIEPTLLRFFSQTGPSKTKQQEQQQNISASCPRLMYDRTIENLENSTLTLDNENMTENIEKNAKEANPITTENNANLQNLKRTVGTRSMISSDNSRLQQPLEEEIIAEDSTQSTSSNAENIGNIHGHALQETTTNAYASDASTIPVSIKRLFDLMKSHYSDLTFVYALSAQLCQDRVPMACYVSVKMALLLSIASCSRYSDVPPIPIVVMGNDTYMANYLMMNIADMAKRFVGPCDDVKPLSTSDGYRNYTWIEADPIQLAKGGVYYVGDWTCLKPARSEKIFKDIETSRVAVENTTRIYPLETAIWTHWHVFKYNARDQQLFNKFVKVFGIPICMDSKNKEILVDFILKQASTEIFESTVDHLSVSAADMRQFLATISERTVDLTTEAANLLRKYFVASRNERPDCLTKQSYPIMKQLAESFAKISLRHEVLIIDAVGAILMCEDFLQHMYGPGMDPPPMLEDGNFVSDIDKHVARFHEWLKAYIDKYSDKGAEFKN